MKEHIDIDRAHPINYGFCCDVRSAFDCDTQFAHHTFVNSNIYISIFKLKFMLKLHVLILINNKINRTCERNA